MEFVFDNTLKNRKLLELQLNDLSLEELNAIPKGFNNNIFWNIAHTVATQQLLAYGLSGNEFLIPTDIINHYRNGTRPQGKIGLADVNQVKSYLYNTVIQTKKDYDIQKFTAFKSYTVSTNGSTLTTIEDAIQFNDYHEGMHMGVILAIRKIIKQ